MLKQFGNNREISPVNIFLSPLYIARIRIERLTDPFLPDAVKVSGLWTLKRTKGKAPTFF